PRREGGLIFSGIMIVIFEEVYRCIHHKYKHSITGFRAPQSSVSTFQQENIENTENMGSILSLITTTNLGIFFLYSHEIFNLSYTIFEPL
ncbi:MAG TPA: hypothetical protein VK021_09440, partial [Flavobacteriaceae bacterium]|nr:hypothetical protein [Flavobacteriaceae bacterium]